MFSLCLGSYLLLLHIFMQICFTLIDNHAKTKRSAFMKFSRKAEAVKRNQRSLVAYPMYNVSVIAPPVRRVVMMMITGRLLIVRSYIDLQVHLH